MMLFFSPKPNCDIQHSLTRKGNSLSVAHVDFLRDMAPGTPRAQLFFCSAPLLNGIGDAAGQTNI